MKECWLGRRRPAERHARSPRPWSLPTGLLMVRWRWCGESAEKFAWNILWARFFTKLPVGSVIRAFLRTDHKWLLSIILSLAMTPVRWRRLTKADRRRL